MVLPATPRLRVGQRDRSVDPYSGKEHPQFGPGGPFEHLAPNRPDLVRNDPEMLDLTLGLLFRYDPP